MADKSSSKKTSFRLMIVVYLLIVALLITVVYATPKVSDAFDETMTIEYGNLKISDEITCYVVRDEVVYFAGESGKAGYYFGEEELVRAGSQVVTVDTAQLGMAADYSGYNKKVKSLLSGETLLDKESVDIITLETELREELKDTEDPLRKQMLTNKINQLSNLANQQTAGALENIAPQEGADVDVSQIGLTGSYSISNPGYVSYKLDGYESEFTPDTMTLLDQKKVTEGTYKYENMCTGNASAKEPLFKIVDNKFWYAVTWIDAGDLGKYKEGKTVTLNMPSGHITGTVHKIVDNGKDIMVIFEFSEFFEGICSTRKITTELITSDYSGLVINNEFITSQDGVPGVLVVGVTGETTFTPIKVRTSDGTNSLVAAGTYYDSEGKQVKTVSVYDEIEKP